MQRGERKSEGDLGKDAVQPATSRIVFQSFFCAGSPTTNQKTRGSTEVKAGDRDCLRDSLRDSLVESGTMLFFELLI